MTAFPRESLVSKLSASVIGPVAGVLTGVVTMRLLGWPEALLPAVFISLFVVPFWALVILPVYFWLPRSSRLWRPSVCTAVGVVAGSAIAFVYIWLVPDTRSTAYLFFVIGAVVGAVTALAGAVTARVGVAHERPNQAIQRTAR